jgi:hypothetical protein
VDHIYVIPWGLLFINQYNHPLFLIEIMVIASLSRGLQPCRNLVKSFTRLPRRHHSCQVFVTPMTKSNMLESLLDLITMLESGQDTYATHALIRLTNLHPSALLAQGLSQYFHLKLTVCHFAIRWSTVWWTHHPWLQQKNDFTYIHWVVRCSVLNLWSVGSSNEHKIPDLEKVPLCSWRNGKIS